MSPESTQLNDDTVHDNRQNPSDALLILAHAAGQPEDKHQLDTESGILTSRDEHGATASSGLISNRFYLAYASGAISTDKYARTEALIQRFITILQM
ncbi:hypothetical protein NUU61_004364 [Penicillium alfredii]|uniref:Uncharacterized protein n=1 Tax=Penicillium alfredii TaxID=1506179 RepID=A0A9W9FLF8_9EURO|nr:uncharacterized protein NUU61_004364 [Penicillium alfredii]KAJ5102142.1 hypothetical protein NUU61_004364 [Penicillium alfredii]